MKKALQLISSALAATLALAGLSVLPAEAHAGHPRITISANPSDEVVLGGSIEVTATVVEHGGAALTTGTITFEYKRGGPNFTEFGTAGAPDGSGQRKATLDVDDSIFELDDEIVLRARYTGTLGSDTSPTVEVVVVEGACLTEAVLISEPTVAGTGTPAPGSSQEWEFTIKVRNCTDQALTGVKVQGGTSGWTTLNGLIDVSDGTATVKQNKKTAVITWLVDLAVGVEETITVPVSGTVGNTCDSVQNLSGNWSAAYQTTDGVVTTKHKTDYTGKAEITVTCPPVE